MGLKSCRIRWKTQNKGYYGVQGHSRSSRSVPIESPYAISYWWLIVTDILSRTVSDLSQLIVQTSLQRGHFDSKFPVEGSPPPIIFARIVRPINALQLWPCQFSHRYYGWDATSENRSKIGDFAPTRSLWSKISGTRGRSPPIIFARLLRPKKLCSRLSASEVRFYTEIGHFAFLRPPLGDRLRGNVRRSS